MLKLIINAVLERSLRFLVHGTSYIITFNDFVLKFEETLATQDSLINFVLKDLVLLFGLKEDNIYCIFVISVELEGAELWNKSYRCGLLYCSTCMN